LVRLLDGEIGRLCEEISLVRLAEASGVALTKQGKERVGHCPFHDDTGASLVVTPDNRWRCSGCGASGDVIDWVVKRNGVSRHHAIELLKEGLPEALAAPEPVKTSTVRRLPSPVTSAADDQALLAQVIGFYHDALKQNPEALAFLEAKGLVHGELIDRFRLGLANRTLGLRLPEKNRKAGAEIRSRLERIGLYRQSRPGKSGQ
jgi:DNA primase